MNKTLKNLAKRLKRQSIKVPKNWKGKGFYQRADFIRFFIEYVYGSVEQTIAFAEIDCRWLSSLIVSAFPFVMITSPDSKGHDERIELYHYSFQRKRFCKNTSLFLINLLQCLNIEIPSKNLIQRLHDNIKGWAWTGDIPLIDKAAAKKALLI